MNLQQWANNGWLRSHQTSPEEISNLLNVEYDYVGEVTDTGVEALIQTVEELRTKVIAFLRGNHSELLYPTQ